MHVRQDIYKEHKKHWGLGNWQTRYTWKQSNNESISKTIGLQNMAQNRT